MLVAWELPSIGFGPRCNGLILHVANPRVRIEEREDETSIPYPEVREDGCRFLRNARHVFVMGPSTKRALVELYGLPEESVTVVGAGPGSPVGDVFKRDRLRRFLFIGTDWALKGGPEVLRAFERLADRHPDVTLTIAGSDPSRPPACASEGTRESPARANDDALLVLGCLHRTGSRGGPWISLLEAFLH